MKTREWSSLNYFQNYSLWAYTKELAQSFFGAGSFLLVHI